MYTADHDSSEGYHAMHECLNSNAREEDASQKNIGDSIDLLRCHGWLKPRFILDNFFPKNNHNSKSAVKTLMELARANLSVARLYEGHINAVALIQLYGDERLQEDTFKLLEANNLMGVWAADGDTPVSLDAHTGKLSGYKIYTSGIGHVSHAVVSIGQGDNARLALVETTDPNRQDAESWDMQGMRATVSGRYSFDHLHRDQIQLFGPPGCYYREPYFVGGVWRIAALQLGGTFGLLDATRDQLKLRKRLSAPAQIARLTPLLQQAYGAIGLIEKAAALCGPSAAHVNLRKMPPSVEQCVAVAVLSRLSTEDIALAAITACQQSIGLMHFSNASESGRKARDLAVYIRQASRDAFLHRAGMALLNELENTLDVWYA